MKTTIENARIRAIRERATGRYAYEGDDGSVMFGPASAETLFFINDDGDNEKLYATMSACPGGHEAVEEVEGYLSVTLP